jgi:hypothetical protein
MRGKTREEMGTEGLRLVDWVKALWFFGSLLALTAIDSMSGWAMVVTIISFGLSARSLATINFPDDGL